MKKKKDNYWMEAINHWLLFCERDRLKTRVKRLLTARNKWRARARVAEARLDEIADVEEEIKRDQAELA